MPPEKSDQLRWFTEEVHPHESSLRSYLKGSFPTVRDVDDVVQESFLRIWRARAGHPIQSARAFLFGIARRLAIDTLRRDRSALHEVVTDFHSTRVLEEGPGVVETVSRRQEIALLTEAIDTLPARCREIVILRKLEGLSHRDIAVRLGISEETVQVQLGRGMHKCIRYLRRRGVLPAAETDAVKGRS
ncbi:MAG: RNA polymerase sigma factor [Opitutae bacterium]|nr:RNA polymerase sigma factor [Opitutae bacterium]